MWILCLYNSRTSFSLLLSQYKVPTASSPLLERKIEEITAGLPARYAKQLHSISEGNSAIIVGYIVAMKTEVKEHTR